MSKELVVAVGSTNPNKVLAVETVFRKMLPNPGDIEVISVKVNSGVREQPLSDDETFAGARNRAERALEFIPQAEFGVGIEGGLHPTSFGWHEKQWVVVLSADGVEGVGSSPGVILPDKFIDLIIKGKTLNQVVEHFTGLRKIGHQQGLFGYLTNNTVTRSAAIESGVAFALSKFIHPELFKD